MARNPFWMIRMMGPSMTLCQENRAGSKEDCNRQTSITAGTIFEATKLPLTVWFQGILMPRTRKVHRR